MIDLDCVLDAYIECALWSSSDIDPDLNSDTSFTDAGFDRDDLAPETLEEMRVDVVAFIKANEDDLTGLDPGQVGHDFWLTRNHHGAGFWDRGLGELGTRLTDAAHVYGSCDLYLGNDNMIYS